MFGKGLKPSGSSLRLSSHRCSSPSLRCNEIRAPSPSPFKLNEEEKQGQEAPRQSSHRTERARERELVSFWQEHFAAAIGAMVVPQGLFLLLLFSSLTINWGRGRKKVLAKMRAGNAAKLIVDALLQRFLPLARRRIDTAQAQVRMVFSFSLLPCLLLWGRGLELGWTVSVVFVSLHCGWVLLEVEIPQRRRQGIEPSGDHEELACF